MDLDDVFIEDDDGNVFFDEDFKENEDNWTVQNLCYISILWIILN